MTAQTQIRPLHDMFNAIPRRYDLINHVITWGLDKGWREQAAKECVANQPKKVLDLCCGTGDLALSAASLAKNKPAITGFDYSDTMLKKAVRKAAIAGKKIDFISGEAAKLPFPDNYFDSVGISFAFRNLTYKNPLAEKHIAEILRVLAPGGRCVIVESSQPSSKLVRFKYHLYLRWYVYRIGSWLSGNRGAYHYLAESAARYYSPVELKNILLTAGFSKVSYRRLFFGASAIHVAIK